MEEEERRSRREREGSDTKRHNANALKKTRASHPLSLSA
jgi:hypothetical protein